MSVLQKLFEENEVAELAKRISKDYVKPSLAVRLAILYSEILNILIHSKCLKEGKLDFKHVPLPSCQCDMIFEENPHLDKDYLKDISLLLRSVNYSKLRNGTKFEKESAEGDILRIVEILKQKVYTLFRRELENKVELGHRSEEITEIITNLVNSQTENDLP